MKKFLFILVAMAVISFAFSACQKEEPAPPSDELTLFDRAAIGTLMDMAKIKVKHLERFVAEGNVPPTKPWPTCWGRKSAKLSGLMADAGITMRDYEEYAKFLREQEKEIELEK